MLNKNYQPLVDSLNDNTSKIRGVIGKKLGKSMRVIPTFEFFYDDTFDYTDEMNNLLDSLNIPKENDNDDEE